MITNKFYEELDRMIPNPVCELNYTKDYELLLAVMMSAQTTDQRVNSVTSILYTKYPTLEALAQAPIEDIISMIRPIGTFHKKAQNIKEICRHLLEECDGKVPNNREYLESLPGVGRKTANVVLSELYQVPCIAVDTHVERVSKRLGFAKEKDSVLEVEKKLTRKLPHDQLNKLHHQLLLFGRYHCKSRNPECQTCPFTEMCKYYKKSHR